MSGLSEFAKDHRINNAHFSGLGAVDKTTLGWTPAESEKGEQKRIQVNERAEIVSLLGGIWMDADGNSHVHGHGSVSRARVSIVAMIYVTEAAADESE